MIQALSKKTEEISVKKWLKKRLLSISPDAASLNKRGFQATNSQVQTQLEKIPKTFLIGYNLGIGAQDAQELTQELNNLEIYFQGFAYEGAAMALTLLDYLNPWDKNHLNNFLKQGGEKHIYMVHVGTGWAIARLPMSLEKYRQNLDPLLGWLAVDGYGFHQGFFDTKNYVNKQKIPQELSTPSRRVFDQGLGRCLWFVEGANVQKIPQTIASFPPPRQGDLWSGIGLACTYAGCVGGEEIKAIKRASGEYLPQLAQGAAFAAKARLRAGNPTPHTSIACEILTGLDVASAAAITDETAVNLTAVGENSIYEVWRQRIQKQLLL